MIASELTRVILPSAGELLYGLGMPVLWVASVVWVAGDADRRGQSGSLWAAIAFVAPVLGALLWLALRKNWPLESGHRAG